MNIDLSKITSENFEKSAIAVFQYQYRNNIIYSNFCKMLQVDSSKVTSVLDIPFLPIQFFKSHQVISGNSPIINFFESSGTSKNTSLSRHYITDLGVYEKSIELGFDHFFNDGNYTIVGLLPHYLERPNSSLVYMVKHWMNKNNQKEYFFLNEFEELASCLSELSSIGQEIILIGISFGLLDFANYISQNSAFSFQISTIIETGGMKGTRAELPKQELISELKKIFPNSKIISEYGMCELFSQAYSDENLNFSCPPWMKVFVSDINDPLSTKKSGTGVAKIIDLANLHSCSFIETQDLITLHDSGQFQIQGRIDHSDMRGCSLMYS